MIRELGNIILEVSVHIPNGVLVVFASHNLL